VANIRTQRRTGLVLRGGRDRRDTLWTPIPVNQTALTGTNATFVAQASTATDALRPYTIVRTRLYVGAHSDQSIAAESWLFAVGMCIVSDQAAAIGITAIPTPVTDLASDAWYLHQFMSGAYGFSSAIGNEEIGLYRLNIDSRAMRKVEDGFDNALVVESSSGFEGVIIDTAGRQLLKLH